MTSQNMLDTIIAQAKLSKKETTKQQKIVENAIAMFAEKGYANTSTSEIAKASGVAEATIFRHYGTKENLLLSVILPFLKNAIPIFAKGIIDNIRPEDFESFEAFLRTLIRNRAEFLKENKEIFQIVVKEFLYREDFRKEMIPLIGSQVSGYIDQALNRFKERGEIVDLPNYAIKRTLGTCIGGFFGWRFILLQDNPAIDYEQELEYLITFILNGIKR